MRSGAHSGVPLRTQRWMVWLFLLATSYVRLDGSECERCLVVAGRVLDRDPEQEVGIQLGEPEPVPRVGVRERGAGEQAGGGGADLQESQLRQCEPPRWILKRRPCS